MIFIRQNMKVYKQLKIPEMSRAGQIKIVKEAVQENVQNLFFHYNLPIWEKMSLIFCQFKRRG